MGENNQSSEVHEMLRAEIVEIKQEIKEDLQNFKTDFHKDITEFKALVSPMIDAYSTALRIGKWTSRALVFLSVVVGLIISFRDVAKAFFRK